MYRHWAFSLLLSLFIPFSQPMEFKVLISCGDVFVKKEKKINKLVSGDIFTIDQTIQIGENGFVSLMDHRDKRVELSEKGNYSFHDISVLFEGAGESLYSRLLASVIKLMTDTKEEEMPSMGAVLRGNDDVYFPQDSSIIMDSVFALRFNNEFNDTLNVLIREAISDKTIMKTKTVSDSLLIAADFGQGTYIWQVYDDIYVKKAGFFIVPTAQERDQYLKEYQNLNTSMINWPDTVALSVMQEWVLSRKLVWSEK